MKRRDFLKTVGAISSASFLSSCGKKWESEKLISYLVPPEEGVIPGEAIYTPSTCTECPAHCGVLVKSVDGDPKKLEGIPGHPINDGGLCMRGQASPFHLYHPERIRTPHRRRNDGTFQPISWDEASSQIMEALKQGGQRGKPNLFLAGRSTGSLSSVIDLFCTTCGIERRPEYEFYSHAALRKAYRLLFHEGDLPRYRIEESDFLLTVGADILETFVNPVSFAGQTTRARQRSSFAWTHLEPHVSLTGLNATNRHALHPGSEPHLLLFLLRQLLNREKEPRPESKQLAAILPHITEGETSERTGLDGGTLREMLRRLESSERPLLVTGGVSTAHADGLHTALLSAILQWHLGMTSRTIDFARSENYEGVGAFNDLSDMLYLLDQGNVGALFLSRTNPVYHLSPDLGVGEKLHRAELTVGMGILMDETLREADLVLPCAHPLETWGEREPVKGIYTLLQPVMPSLSNTPSEEEILLQLTRTWKKEPWRKNPQEELVTTWRERFGESGKQEFLRKGFMVTEVRPKEIALDLAEVSEHFRSWQADQKLKEPVLMITPSIRHFDGRGRPLPLLSEIPDPMTTITYGRWVSLAEDLAAKIGVKEKDEIRLSASNWSTTLAAKIQPGLPPGVLTLQRDLMEQAPLQGSLQSGETLQYLSGITLRKTGACASIPILSGSPSQHGRGLIPDPAHLREEHRQMLASLYPKHPHPDYRWVMAIDLDRCIGCAACVAACYIENNVAIVGKREHLIGREMSWLRIEPYYTDGGGGAEFLPMLCQQCDDAPCEPVCPVYAAYHNPEGLNMQVYNRCVGTRYCSNNCPYKVRRFNWFEHRLPEPLDRMYNPELFVRWKGVMEKCTFCIQRIRKARDHAEDESRKIRDGEVTTACAQSCPTRAIVFGNILDKESRVYGLAHSKEAYRIYQGLGTEPSVYYLKGSASAKKTMNL